MDFVHGERGSGFTIENYASSPDFACQAAFIYRVGRSPTRAARSAFVLGFTPAHSFAQEFRGVLEVELFLNARTINLHRFDADAE